MFSKFRFKQSESGFTLVEAIVATSIFAVGVVALIQLTLVARATSDTARDNVQASYHLQEGMEAVRLVRNASWSNISTDGAFQLTAQPTVNPPWTLTPGSTEAIGKYNRAITIQSVKREDSNANGALDSEDKLSSIGFGCTGGDTNTTNEDDEEGADENECDDEGSFDDNNTKRITVTVSWKQGNRTLSRALYAYLTNWQE